MSAERGVAPEGERADGGGFAAGGPAETGVGPASAADALAADTSAADEAGEASPDGSSGHHRRRASRLVAQAVHLHHHGAYNAAAGLCAQALALDPSLPGAQLVLGKVLLAQGSAAADTALLAAAERHVRMAAAIDPELADARRLLELFVVDRTP